MVQTSAKSKKPQLSSHYEDWVHPAFRPAGWEYLDCLGYFAPDCWPGDSCENWPSAVNAPQVLVNTPAPDPADSPSSLRQRLDNANRYFRRKASEVFTDAEAMELLDSLYRDVVIDIEDFDACKHGLPLAMLTAANFCEIGANIIYITDSGIRFIESLKQA